MKSIYIANMENPSQESTLEVFFDREKAVETCRHWCSYLPKELFAPRKTPTISEGYAPVETAYVARYDLTGIDENDPRSAREIWNDVSLEDTDVFLLDNAVEYIDIGAEYSEQ